jgi:uncharacterized membrane protein YgaE (UPF0421/DUF939 family)
MKGVPYSVKLRRYSIGYRILKTAIGAAAAIWIAQAIGLNSYASAAILTVLCIQPTKRKSVRAILSRIVATLIGLLFAFVFFEGIAYHPSVFAIMILLFLPTLVSLRFQDGFVSSVVILLHIYSHQNFTLDLLVNELMLMAIGFGTAFIVNFYMPDISRKLKKYQVELESLYSKIIKEIANYLRNGDLDWDGKELTDAAAILRKGKALAYQDVENHLARHENEYYSYFDMREEQFEIIERVLPKVTAIPLVLSHSHLIADFLEELAENVHPGNTAKRYISKLEGVKEEFAELPLPHSHEMFKAMASLYQFIEEMEHYLEIKSRFKGLK